MVGVKGMASKLSSDLENKAIKLYKSGIKIQKILKRLHIERTTFFRILRRRGINRSRHPPRTERACEWCKNNFLPVQRKTKFCSHSCQFAWQKGKTLNTGRTHFKKGFKPWNKGIAWAEMSGENNPNYKPKIKVRCPTCKKHFKVHPYRVDTAEKVYCSAKCAIKDKWKDPDYREHMVKAHLGQEAWNKGKKWAETYDKKKAEELLRKNREHILRLYESGKFPKQTHTGIEMRGTQRVYCKGVHSGKRLLPSVQIP
jgi:transposase-like protein